MRALSALNLALCVTSVSLGSLQQRRYMTSLIVAGSLVAVTADASGSSPILDGCDRGAWRSSATQGVAFGSDVPVNAMPKPGCSGWYTCPAGTYCAGGKRFACPAGSWSGAGSDACSPCDAGYSCQQQLDPISRFLVGSASPQQRPCGSAAVYCPAGTGEPLLVPAGWYTAADSSRIHQCEPGYYCSAGIRRPCPAGTYGADVGLSTPACSGLCEAGYRCPAGSSSPRTMRCGAGADSFCPAGTGAPGTASVYLPGQGGNDLITEAAADDGMALPVPLQQLLPEELASLPEAARAAYTASVQAARLIPGSEGEGIGTAASGLSNLQGLDGAYTVREGLSSSESRDSSGSNDVGGLSTTTSYSSDAPPARVEDGADESGGTGAARSAQRVCPLGFWCGVDGRRRACPAGRAGSRRGETSALCAQDCTAGYYCPAGSASATQYECGGSDVYCLAGASAPLPVPSGHYGYGGGSDRTRTAIAICPKGHYCAAGAALPCPGGRYGDSYGLTSPACTAPCPAGYYCPAGSVEGTALPCGDAGHYCPPGSAAPITVSDGYFSLRLLPGIDLALPAPGTAASLQSWSMPASLRQDGRLVDFASASDTQLQRTGLTSEGVSNAAAASFDWDRLQALADGSDAGRAALSTLRLLHPASEWAQLLPVTVLPFVPTADYWASVLQGTEPVPPPTTVLDALWRAAVGSAPVSPAGTRLLLSAVDAEDTATIRTAERACDAGYYCVAGVRTACPAGRYGSERGLTTAECSGPCAAGYYCPEGSTAADAVPCGDRSAYCPAGSGAPITVSLGYYTLPVPLPASPDDAAGAAAVAAVDPLETRAELSIPLLPPLLYTQRSLLNATTRVVQKECPPGTYCEGGVPFLCPAGSYGSGSGAFTRACSGVCDAGWYCPPGSQSPQQEPCGNATYYCPAGAGAPQRVTDGYYTLGGRTDAGGGATPAAAAMECGGPSTDAEALGWPPALAPAPAPAQDMPLPSILSSRALACTGSAFGDADSRTTQAPCEPGYFCAYGLRLLCPPGTYGSVYGSATAGCDGLCKEGYYCPWGSISSAAVECGSADVYCPRAAAAPSPVSDGYYTTPLSAPATRRTGQQQCEPGYYCTGGIRRACAAGSYGSERGLTTAECSGPCAAGYYCPEGSTAPNAVACGSKEYARSPASVYCAPASSAPTRVSPGFYTVGGFSRVVGKPENTTRVSQVQCEAGHFCAAGTKYQCPAGTYGATPGLTTASCSGGCSPGHFCPPGSTTPTEYRCGDLYLFLVDVLSSVPVQAALAGNPFNNSDRISIVDKAYNASRLMQLYKQLEGGTAVGSGFAGSAATGAGVVLAVSRGQITWFNSSDFVNASVSEALRALDQALPGDPVPGLGLAEQPLTRAQEADALLQPLQASNTSTSLLIADIVRRDNKVYLQLRSLELPVGLGQPGSNVSSLGALIDGSSASSNGTVVRTYEASIPWRSGLRFRLPPLSVPLQSFAAVHRQLVTGGPASVYCPGPSVTAASAGGMASVGTGFPLPVPIGHYSTTSSDAILAATADPSPMELANVTRDGIQRAEPGYYAVAGIRYPCHPGTYGSTAGATGRTCTAVCPAGHACPLNTTTPIPCEDGWYAPAGSASCIQCPDVAAAAAAAAAAALTGAAGPTPLPHPAGRQAVPQRPQVPTAPDGKSTLPSAAPVQRCKNSRHCCGL